MSSAALADKVGCSRQHMSAIQKGQRGTSEELLQRIADALDCEVRELMPPPEEPALPPPVPLPPWAAVH